MSLLILSIAGTFSVYISFFFKLGFLLFFEWTFIRLIEIFVKSYIWALYMQFLFPDFFPYLEITLSYLFFKTGHFFKHCCNSGY